MDLEYRPNFSEAKKMGILKSGTRKPATTGYRNLGSAVQWTRALKALGDGEEEVRRHVIITEQLHIRHSEL